jgi:hypothetical protein
VSDPGYQQRGREKEELGKPQTQEMGRTEAAGGESWKNERAEKITAEYSEYAEVQMSMPGTESVTGTDHVTTCQGDQEQRADRRSPSGR